MKPQHKYVIQDKKGAVLKTGISGSPLNGNGSSKRANSQLKKAPEGATAKVIETEIPGRAAALKSEQKEVNKLFKAKEPMTMHKRPPPNGT